MKQGGKNAGQAHALAGCILYPAMMDRNVAERYGKQSQKGADESSSSYCTAIKNPGFRVLCARNPGFRWKRKHTNPNPFLSSDFDCLVDLKGIEPSNLTDANRALSQLSYRPK